jgi:hypothetical protein
MCVVRGCVGFTIRNAHRSDEFEKRAIVSAYGEAVIAVLIGRNVSADVVWRYDTTLKRF